MCGVSVRLAYTSSMTRKGQVGLGGPGRCSCVSPHKSFLFRGTDQEQQLELAFSAGVFAGDGHFRCDRRGPNLRPNLSAGISMLDHRCVERLAAVLSVGMPRWADYTNILVHYELHKKGGVMARFTVGGKRALHVFGMLHPYLVGTQKGDQLETACFNAGIILTGRD